MKHILVVGGAGYVGAVLVPKLLRKGYHVRVYDLYIYGEGIFKNIKNRAFFEEIKGDVRDFSLLEKALRGVDTLIHFACISNDPSYELDPQLSKSINYEAFKVLVKMAKEEGIRRFIYASSSSVYGIKEEKEVTENLPLEPLTDYSKYKALCEEILLREQDEGFIPVIIRSATVCGYSPRMRLDLTVNLLTAHAVNRGKITVFGGEQKRPNIHIEDITDYYVELVQIPEEKIAGKIYNAGCENYRILQIAHMIKEVMDKDIKIERVPTNDLRSYYICSEKIKKELGLVPKRTIREAIKDVIKAFEKRKIKDWQDAKYYNVKKMKAISLR
jgi:nucleoside-diphosphate-sugar epimerase